MSFLMMSCICEEETLFLYFYVSCFIYVYVLVSHYGTLVMIYIIRLFMVYVFYFMFCENKKFI